MSLTYSQLTTKLDNALGTNTSSYPLANKVIDINLALDEAMAIIFAAGGTWQYDDYNHTKYPIITTNLVATQRDYSFTTDEEGILILDIYKVMAKDSASGTFKKLTPVDMQTDPPVTMTDGNDNTGIPTKYDKTATGIFLDLIPSYNSTGGLKIFINREGHKFASDDTTATAGIDGLCHDFLYLKPAYEFARDKGMSNAEQLYRDLIVSTKKIQERYGKRERDIVRRIIPNVENTK
ncbi:MAG: hypothetical protein GY861_18320 [bacterium]|nr:hypothetical protein [bacterium]